MDDQPERPGLPVSALTQRASLQVVNRFEDLDDDTALALRRALLRVEQRWQRPLRWLLVGIPASCSGLAVVGVDDAIRPMALLFAALYFVALVVVPLTAGFAREESAQLGIATTVLRQLRRLDVNTRWRARNDAAFLLELHAAQTRERQHRERPTLMSTLRRLWAGP